MSTHKDLVVSQCGLYIDESRPYIAATPDGLIWCSCCGKGVLEIKCPYSYRDVPVEKMASEASTFLNPDGKLKQNHKYYYQVKLRKRPVKLYNCFAGAATTLRYPKPVRRFRRMND